MEMRNSITKAQEIMDALQKFQVRQEKANQELRAHLDVLNARTFGKRHKENRDISFTTLSQEVRDVSQKFQEFLASRATTKQEQEPQLDSYPQPKSTPEPEPKPKPEPEPELDPEPESESKPETMVEPTSSLMPKPASMIPPEGYDPFLRSLPSQTLIGVNVVPVDLRPTRQYRHRGHVVHVSCSGHIISADMDMMTLFFSQPRWMIEAIRKLNLDVLSIHSNSPGGEFFKVEENDGNTKTTLFQIIFLNY
jgi:hypothetical protein